ncbi:MAG: hypothetical protein ACRCVV_14560 [Shewanella sp.]|uniref:hypothetical protein n=1 Tax=Aeromonas popoffii TaxID=70856 RepID=UPI003F37E7DB
MSEEIKGQPEEQPVDVAALQAELESLRGHHDKLLGETKAAKAKAKEEAEAARIASEEAARKSGDVSALDKSWQEKYAKAEADYGAKLTAAEKQLQTVLVDNVAQKAAMDIAVDAECAELLADKLRGSLGLAEVDGKMQTVVMDADGKRSALTVEELKKQLVAKYPRLVKGNPAGGAGGVPQPAGGAGGSNNGGSMVDRARNIIKSQG